MDISTALTIVNVTGIGLLGGSILYNNWRSGKDKVGSEVLSLYKQQIGALEADILRGREKAHELGNQLQALTLELGKLRGEVVARDKQITEYREIFQNRDPQLLEILAEIRDFMASLDAKTDRNEKRNIKIDQDLATIKEKE
jgi:chromosome segregation ATPase